MNDVSWPRILSYISLGDYLPEELRMLYLVPYYLRTRLATEDNDDDEAMMMAEYPEQETIVLGLRLE